ncbi:MAG: nuclear transport factor 2 family protein [Pseudomonadota bacterium]
MSRPVLFALLSIACTVLSAQAAPLAVPESVAAGAEPARNDAAAEVEVRAVIERFRTAIIAGDGDALRALFLPEPRAWVSVLDDAGLARVRARDPLASRVRPDTYERFARSVQENAGREEEVFSGIGIRTDGLVATVVFDFDYRIDGKVGNRGLEAWQLVRTDAGWKIVSLVYSSRSRP